MPHITYPTPGNKKLDIDPDDNKNVLLTEKMLRKHSGPDLMELNDVARYWASEHTAGTYSKKWFPIYTRIQSEIERRLEVGREFYSK